MQLTSQVFTPTSPIPSDYTCDGRDVNPPLAIAAVPADAQSLALIVHDPDAPGGDFVHWLVWNIDPKTTEVGEGSVPSGAVEGTTDFSAIGYGGPCPPSGSHRYVFELYATRSPVGLARGATRDQLAVALEEAGISAQAELVGTYQRPR